MAEPINGEPVKRKRNKPTLVCTNCKRRKIKCDRKIPCTSCSRVKLGFSCAYESRPTKKKKKPVTETPTEEDTLVAEIERLRLKLEDIQQAKDLAIYDSRHPHFVYKEAHDSPLIPMDGDYLLPESNPFMYNPVDREDEQINFYEGYNTIQIKPHMRRTSFGPLSWTSLMQLDRWIGLLRRAIDCRMTDPNISTSVFNIKVPNVAQMLKRATGENGDFHKAAFEHDGVYDVTPLKALFSEDRLLTFNSSGLVLGKTTFKSGGGTNVLDKIRYIIPKRRVVWMLVDRFFGSLYPFMPFLDESYFREDISKILGPPDYTDAKFDSVRIETRLDIARVAILFIVIRLAYLLVISNRNVVNDWVTKREWLGDKFTNAAEIAYLLLNPVDITVVDVAQDCIDTFQLLRKTSLVVFQASLYMRIYRQFAPEDGDGVDGGDSQVSSAVLIQMAYSLGLNREPSLFPEDFPDPKINNLTRKIWHYLYRSDAFQSFNIGNPPLVDPRQFDALPPYFEAGNENSRLQPLEVAVADSMYFFYLKCVGLRKMLDLILDIKKFTPINEITHKLNNFEKTTRQEFSIMDSLAKDTNDVLQPRDCTTNHYNIVCAVRYILCSGCSLVSIYYHIYLHYEKAGNFELCFFYIRKMFAIIQEFMAPFYHHILYGKLSKDGLLLNPTVIMAIQKTNQVCISVFCRILFTKITFENIDDPSVLTDPHYRGIIAAYSALADTLYDLGLACTRFCNRFAGRYYYAWRVAKVLEYVYHTVTDRNCYLAMQENLAAKNVKMFQFTTSQVHELTQVVAKTVDDIALLLNYKDECTKADFVDTTSHVSYPLPFVNTGSSNDSTPKQFVAEQAGGPDVDQMWLQMLANKSEQHLAFHTPAPEPSRPDPHNKHGIAAILNAANVPAPSHAVPIGVATPMGMEPAMSEEVYSNFSEVLLSTDFDLFGGSSGLESFL